MAALRHALRTRTGWLAWALALALAVRMLVPAGYMPDRIDGTPGFRLCFGAMPATAMPEMPGMGDKHDDHGKQADSGCPFAIAAMASLAGGAAIVLVVPLIAPFVVGETFAAPAPRARTARLRPPAQGPPSI